MAKVFFILAKTAKYLPNLVTLDSRQEEIFFKIYV